jgi:hypothetical protein
MTSDGMIRGSHVCFIMEISAERGEQNESKLIENTSTRHDSVDGV